MASAPPAASNAHRGKGYGRAGSTGRKPREDAGRQHRRHGSDQRQTRRQRKSAFVDGWRQSVDSLAARPQRRQAPHRRRSIAGRAVSEPAADSLSIECGSCFAIWLLLTHAGARPYVAIRVFDVVPVNLTFKSPEKAALSAKRARARSGVAQCSLGRVRLIRAVRNTGHRRTFEQTEQSVKTQRAGTKAVRGKGG